MTKTQRIFVVDEDSSSRRGLVRLLCKAGHEVAGFDSLDAFRDALASDATGCLVLDVTSIGAGHEDLPGELDERGARLAIIVVATDDGPESKGQARALRATAFFRKPVDGTALLDAILWAQD